MTHIGLGAVALIALLAAAAAVQARIADGGTPGWDSASHGLQGYVLAQDLANVDLPSLAADALGHEYRYPPGHPTLLALAYLLFGASWWTAIGVSGLLFAALAIAQYATAESKAAGWISAILTLTSPAFLALSGQILLEIPAAILVVLSMRLYSRSLEDDAAVRPLGWTLTVFMLTAAQYAACTIVTLMAFELWRSRAWVRELMGKFIRSRSRFHPLHVLIGVAILTAIAIRLSGGWRIPIGHRTLSMTRAGGPLIAAALLAGIRVGWLVWKHRADLRAAVPRRYRDIFITAVVPIYIWVFVIYPPRFQQFAEWISRPPVVHERTDPAHWTFYPEYFATAGHAAVAVALGVVALAAASFFRRGRPERIRFLQWAAIAGALLVMTHHARQTRFIVPFLVIWWMLATETLVTLVSGKTRFAIVSATTAALVLASVGLYGNRLDFLVSPPEINRQYAWILDKVVEKVGDAPSVRVIGGIDGLSHHLFEWEFRKRWDVRNRPVRFNLDLPDGYASDPLNSSRKSYDDWIRKSPEAVVVALEHPGLGWVQNLSEFSKFSHVWPELTMLWLRNDARHEVRSVLYFDALTVRIYRTSTLPDAIR